MCLRLVASLAALAVAQQEPESYVRPSSMNVDAYKKAKDEAAMLRLLLANPNAGDAAYYSQLVDIAAELGHCHVLDNALARGGHPHGESGSGPAPQGTDSWMEVSSSDDAEKRKGALGEDQAHKVKVDEHATQHPIGVVQSTAVSRQRFSTARPQNSNRYCPINNLQRLQCGTCRHERKNIGVAQPAANQVQLLHLTCR